MSKIALITGITSQIPDGMLVRTSSVDPRSTAACRMHGQFANALFASLAPEATPRLIGKSGGD